MMKFRMFSLVGLVLAVVFGCAQDAAQSQLKQDADSNSDTPIEEFADIPHNLKQAETYTKIGCGKDIIYIDEGYVEVCLYRNLISDIWMFSVKERSFTTFIRVHRIEQEGFDCEGGTSCTDAYTGLGVIMTDGAPEEVVYQLRVKTSPGSLTAKLRSCPDLYCEQTATALPGSHEWVY